MLEWLFRNRQTGRITVAQAPNAPLWVFIGGAAARRITSGSVATGASIIATGALVVWAVDELVRGVNPWRRILGSTVLAIGAIRVVLQ